MPASSLVLAGDGGIGIGNQSNSVNDADKINCIIFTICCYMLSYKPTACAILNAYRLYDVCMHQTLYPGKRTVMLFVELLNRKIWFNRNRYICIFINAQNHSNTYSQKRLWQRARYICVQMCVYIVMFVGSGRRKKTHTAFITSYTIS